MPMRSGAVLMRTTTSAGVESHCSEELLADGQKTCIFTEHACIVHLWRSRAPAGREYCRGGWSASHGVHAGRGSLGIGRGWKLVRGSAARTGCAVGAEWWVGGITSIGYFMVSGNAQNL